MSERLSAEEVNRNYNEAFMYMDSHGGSAMSVVRLRDHIDAITAENADLRQKVEAAEALNKEVRAIASQTVVARTFGDWKYVTLEFWQHTVKRLIAAHDAYRATATDEGG